jgi:hypothetical protein
MKFIKGCLIGENRIVLRFEKGLFRRTYNYSAYYNKDNKTFTWYNERKRHVEYNINMWSELDRQALEVLRQMNMIE